MKKLRHTFKNWALPSFAALVLFLGENLRAQPSTETGEAPKLLSVVPDGVYANEEDYEYPLYELTLVGERLDDKNLKIFLNDRELQAKPLEQNSEVPPRKGADAKEPAPDAVESTPPPKAYRERESNGSELKLWINKEFYSGRAYLKVGKVITPTASSAPATRPQETGSPTSTPSPTPAPRLEKSKEVPVVLATINQGTGRWLFRGGTILLALVVLFLPVFLVKKGGRSYEVPDNGWLISALFLDKETATYSLSKLQFYIWTAVSVVGYLYLAASRAMVQNVWEFIDIPTNLPGILFISGTTGALAQVVTTQRGPKGAGEQHPSVADFVASGGIVSVERVQFLLWTIIGALMFLWHVLSQDPVSIRELPKVPESFLGLMGISSFGYLAGKVARRPGPVINNISVAPLPPIKDEPVTLTPRGRILSQNADFKITYKVPAGSGESDQERERVLTPDLLDGAIGADEVDEQSKPEKTYKKLVIKVKKADPIWFWRGKFVISNPDGQSASWPLPGMPEIREITPTVVSPPTTPPSTATRSLKLALKGMNLAQAATFKIDDAKVTDAELPRTGIKVLQPDEERPQEFARELELTISKPSAGWITTGKHKLTINNPDGQSAEKEYTIDAKAVPPAPAV